MKSRYPLKRFTAVIHVIAGPTAEPINPVVDVPPAIVARLKAEAKKNQSLPVEGTLQGKPFKANVVKYLGAWRLYLNGIMRKAAGVEAGDRVSVVLWHDPVPRLEPVPPGLKKALVRNKRAKAAFEALAPSRRKEILRYLNALKTPGIRARHIKTTLKHLTGRDTGGELNALFRKPRPRRKKAGSERK